MSLIQNQKRLTSAVLLLKQLLILYYSTYVLNIKPQTFEFFTSSRSQINKCYIADVLTE
jgi:hypothetical protein